MKRLITAISFFAVSSAYAEKVTGVGMQGYFVWQDSNGNKYITHPTVPGVAYDLTGKKLDSVPGGIKYATVQSDGTIMPFNEHGSGVFSTISWIVILAILGVAVWGFLKGKKRIAQNRQEIEATLRIKENLTNEAGNIFSKFHKNFRPSQIDYYEENTNGALLSTIRNSIMKESDFKDVNIDSLNYDVEAVYRDKGNYGANVRYSCTRTESSDGKTKQIKSSEIWKFELVDNKWVINAIVEISPTIVNEIKDTVEEEKPTEKQMEIGGDKFHL